jgi:hypothetical protein
MTNNLLWRFRGRVPGLKPLAFRCYFTGLKPGASTFAGLKQALIFVGLARVLKKSAGREILRTSGAEAPFSPLTLLRGLKPSPASKLFCSTGSSAFACLFRHENEFPPAWKAYGFTGGY